MHPVEDLWEAEQGREHVRVEQPGQVYFGVEELQIAQRDLEGGFWLRCSVSVRKTGLGGRDGWSGLVVSIVCYNWNCWFCKCI